MNNTLHRVLVAAGLSRVYEHMADGPFAILSAWKGELNPEQNSLRDNDLRGSLRELGLGYMPSKGVWKSPEGELQHEDSLFVPGIDRETAIGLGRRFQQHEIIYGDGGQYSFILVKTGEDDPKRTGQVAERFHHLDPGEVPPKGKTEVKHKPFTFRDEPFDGAVNADEANGAWAVANQRWWPGFDHTANFDRPQQGEPHFFWNKAESKLPFPRFGFDFEIASHKERRAGGYAQEFAAYLPLGAGEGLKRNWRERVGT